MATMNNLSLDKKLFGGFGALLLAFVALALGAWILSGRLNDRVSELANVSGRSMQLAGDAQYLAADIKAAQRQMVILAAKQQMSQLEDQATAVETNAKVLVERLYEISRLSRRTEVRSSAEEARSAIQMVASPLALLSWKASRRPSGDQAGTCARPSSLVNSVIWRRSDPSAFTTKT